jgi:hypothetical protein
MYKLAVEAEDPEDACTKLNLAALELTLHDALDDLAEGRELSGTGMAGANAATRNEARAYLDLAGEGSIPLAEVLGIDSDYLRRVCNQVIRSTGINALERYRRLCRMDQIDNG